MLPAALALLLQATPAQVERTRWVANPRTANGTWVADPSHHLRDSTIALLNAEIGALERRTGAEIAVVVVDSTSGLEPFDFALAIPPGRGAGRVRSARSAAPVRSAGSPRLWRWSAPASAGPSASGAGAAAARATVPTATGRCGCSTSGRTT